MYAIDCIFQNKNVSEIYLINHNFIAAALQNSNLSSILAAKN